MKKNVGKVDSYIRYALGVVFIVLAIVWTWWMLIPAAIAVGTAALGVCPLYLPFGINTRKEESKKD
ncbi:MAG: DUF2892 domain-containing protein [Bacilli bacterium]|nr:DUF2892 domain-containing protein [Bacilli bacterium]MBN2876496.1 DUF2892 domain-containing protein [Bacilli bacterium]